MSTKKTIDPAVAVSPELIEYQLRDIAPNVAFSAKKSEDRSYKWDGDGPDPVLEGFRAYDVTVKAKIIWGGRELEGESHLGGHYSQPREKLGDIGGYFPQMLLEALENLRDENRDKIEGYAIVSEINAARKFLKAVMKTRWEMQHPAYMSSEVYGALQKELESLEMSNAKGQDTPEGDERIRKIDALLDLAPWRIDVDAGGAVHAHPDRPPPDVLHQMKVGGPEHEKELREYRDKSGRWPTTARDMVMGHLAGVYPVSMASMRAYIVEQCIGITRDNVDTFLTDAINNLRAEGEITVDGDQIIDFTEDHWERVTESRKDQGCTVAVGFYRFDELSEKAKEKARDWYREKVLAGDTGFSDLVIDDAKQALRFAGFEIANVYFSGFSSQGDGACFEGSWRAADVNPDALRQHAPTDQELHRIVDELARVAKQYPGTSFKVKHSGRYSHENSTTFDFNFAGEDGKEVADDAAVKTLTDVSRDVMRWIYRDIEEAYSASQSNENVDEEIRANDYVFTAEGERKVALGTAEKPIATRRR